MLAFQLCRHVRPIFKRVFKVGTDVHFDLPCFKYCLIMVVLLQMITPELL